MQFVWAFVVGGLFCVIGQILIDKTRLTPAKILVGFVVAGVILGGAGVYEYISGFAEAGATVPLIGFGALLAKGTREAVDEHGLLGAVTGPLCAGAGGITAAMLCGLLVSFFCKPKSK